MSNIDHSEGMQHALHLTMDCQKEHAFHSARLYIAGENQMYVYASAMAAIKQFAIHHRIAINDVSHSLSWIGE